MHETHKVEEKKSCRFIRFVNKNKKRKITNICIKTKLIAMRNGFLLKTS